MMSIIKNNIKSQNKTIIFYPKKNGKYPKRKAKKFPSR